MSLLVSFSLFCLHQLVNLQMAGAQEPQFQRAEILERPRFFKYQRQQFDSPIPSDPSADSIQSSKVVVVNRNGEDTANETFNRIIEAKQENATATTRSVFVPTSGVRKPCKIHADCYGLREPDEWCPLPSKDQYIEKGCYCDSDNGFCAIEKVSNITTTREFTDCAPMATSKCSGKKTTKADNKSDIHTTK